MAQIALATHVVYGHAYSFSLSGLAELIKTQAAKGVRHNWIFDRSQYLSTYNPHMKDVVDSLIGAKNVTIYLATSHDHSISHDKFAVVDTGKVQYGSQNYTGDAERQSGHVIIESGRAVAKGFTVHWQYIAATAVLLTAPLSKPPATAAIPIPVER
jgi:hypothetical protein